MACIRYPTSSSIIMAFAIFLSAAWAMESDAFPNNEPAPVKPYHTLPYHHPSPPPPPTVKPAGDKDKKIRIIITSPPHHGGHQGPESPPPDVKPAGHDEDKKKGRGHSGHGFHLPKHPPPSAVKPAHHDVDRRNPSPVPRIKVELPPPGFIGPTPRTRSPPPPARVIFINPSPPRCIFCPRPIPPPPPPPPEIEQPFLRPLLPPRTPPPQIRIIIRPRPPPPPRPAVSATKSSNEKTES